MKKMLCVIFSSFFIFTGCNYKIQNSNYTIQTEEVEAVVVNKHDCVHIRSFPKIIDLEVKYQNYYGTICTDNNLAVGSKIQVKLVKTYDGENIRNVCLAKLCY